LTKLINAHKPAKETTKSCDVVASVDTYEPEVAWFLWMRV